MLTYAQWWMLQTAGVVSCVNCTVLGHALALLLNLHVLFEELMLERKQLYTAKSQHI